MKSFFDNYVGRFVVGMLLLIGWCVTAQAQSTCTQVATNRVRICVSGPTQFVGDTNIPAGTSITYKYFQQSGSSWNQIGTNASTTFASELTTGVLSPGTYVFRVTATVGTSESDPSATASKTTTDPQPKPPTVVVAQLEVVIKADGTPVAIAYLLTPQGKRSNVVAGMAKLTAPCLGPVVDVYRGQEYREVLLRHPTRNTPNVYYWKTAQDTRVVAPCAGA